MRGGLRIAAFAGLLSLGLVAAEPQAILYRAPQARSQVTDWRRTYGCSPQLNGTLQAYEAVPTMTNALRVLKHFGELAGNDAMRARMIQEHHDLLLSIDVAKYEMVLHTIHALGADVGSSRRVGSSGEWFGKLVAWANGGPKPQMDPARQFKSDDDVTNLLAMARITADPVAAATLMEQINGTKAAEVYRRIANEFGVDLQPSEVKTAFLSPTDAHRIVGNALLNGELTPALAELARQNFVFALTLSNSEKYNTRFSVEMLEIWAYEKGTLTELTRQPGGRVQVRTAPIGSPANVPKAPDYRDLLGYMADNYRQIYGTHEGDFFSECKYLARMVDGWERAEGPQLFDPAWKRIAEEADLIYKNSGRRQTADDAARLRQEVRKAIHDITVRASEYSMVRLADSIAYAYEKASAKRDAAKGGLDAIPLADLLNEPFPPNMKKITEGMDLFAIAHANLGPEAYAEVKKTALARVQSSLEGQFLRDVFQSRVFVHALAAAEEAGSRAASDASNIELVRKKLDVTLPSVLAESDLRGILRDIEAGKTTRESYSVEGGRIQLRTISLHDPQQAEAMARILEAHAEVRKAPAHGKTVTRRFREMMQAAKASGAMAKLQESLRRFMRQHDTSAAKPVPLPRVQPDGSVEIKTWRATGVQWGQWALEQLLSGVDLYGKVTSGKDIADNLLNISNGAATEEEYRQALGSMVFGALGIYDAPQKLLAPAAEAGTPTNLIKEIVTGNVALAGVDAGVRDQVSYALTQDIVCVCQPELCPVFAVWDLSKWAWKEFRVHRSNTKLLDGLMEKGVWVPADFKGLAQLPAGELPKLRGFKGFGRGVAGNVLPLEQLTKLNRRLFLLNGTDFDPREELLEIAYERDYMKQDTVLQASIDAIQRAAPRAMLFRFGNVRWPADPKDWRSEPLARAGIAVSRAADDTKELKGTIVTLNYQDQPLSPELLRAFDPQRKVFGYLVADFWRKQQQILEGPVLEGLTNAAARKWLDRLRKDEILDRNFDFTTRISEIDADVANIDKALWPRIARSADPYPGVVYDPERDTAILAEFRRATAGLRSQLGELEKFLKDSSRASMTYVLPGNARVVITLDRAQGAEKSAELFNTLRDHQFKFKQNYGSVASKFDEAKALYAQFAPGAAGFEPFHVAIRPDEWARTFDQADGNPDVVRAGNWLTRYNSISETVANDIWVKARYAPEGSRVGELGIAALRFLQMGDWVIDRRGTPKHPSWNKLMRMQFQILRASDLNGFSDQVVAAEIRTVLGPMVLGDGQRVYAGTGSVGDAIERMKADYQRLLNELTEQFEITLAPAGVAKPFLGQAMPLKAAVTLASEPGKTFPFPQNVKRFRWSTGNCSGSTSSGPEETSLPYWSARFYKADPACVKVWALDDAGNYLAANKVFIAEPQPLTLSGTIKIGKGDYPGKPPLTVVQNRSALGVTTMTTVLGSASQPGAFQFRVVEFNKDAFNRWPASASFTIAGRTFESNKSIYNWYEETGQLILETPLVLQLPRFVDVQVMVRDAARKAIPDAKVTIQGLEEAPITGTRGRAYIMGLGDLKVRVEYPRLGISLTAGSFRVSPDERRVDVETDLPLLLPGSLEISGGFTPAIGPRKPQFTGGSVQTNIGNGTVSNGTFRFSNNALIDLRKPAQLDVNATVNDDSGRTWKMYGAPPRFAIGAAPNPLTVGDLAMICETRLEVRLADVTGRPVPPSQAAVYDDTGRWVAEQAGFTMERLFAAPGEVLNVQGAFAFSSGGASQGTVTFRAEETVERPPPPKTIQLPFYLPGSLRIRGRVEVAGVPPNYVPPQQVSLRMGPLSAAAAPNSAFEIVNDRPIPASQPLTIEAVAESQGVRYQGRAEVRLNAGAVADVLVRLAPANAPPPSSPAPPPDTERLIGDLTATIQRCEYQNALRLALTLQQQMPNYPWLAGNLANLQGLARLENQIDQLLAAGRVNEARQIAGTDRCLMARAGGGQAPPSPVPASQPQPGTGAMAGSCRGVIRSNRTEGYAGDPIAISVALEPPFQHIVKVELISGGAVAPAKPAGNGVWNANAVFSGRKNMITLQFVAKDKDDKKLCEGSVQLSSKGVQTQ